MKVKTWDQMDFTNTCHLLLRIQRTEKDHWVLSTPPPRLQTHHLNLTGWRDDPENHIMYISVAVAVHLHVGDSSNKTINQWENIKMDLWGDWNTQWVSWADTSSLPCCRAARHPLSLTLRGPSDHSPGIFASLHEWATTARLAAPNKSTHTFWYVLWHQGRGSLKNWCFLENLQRVVCLMQRSS